MSLSVDLHRPPTLAIFCKVVDNYGDIGICWRLARQLQREQGVAVTLFVDDLLSFQRICPEVEVGAGVQERDGVVVRHWHGQDGSYTPEEVADVVIEFFACDIPPGYIAAMAQCVPPPVWLNLEGLTAEDWVEGCHRLPSMHPRLKLTKHFFFPGYTAATGGLLREHALDGERRAFLAEPGIARDFLARVGLGEADMDALKVTLFCYPHAPVAELFAAWRGGDRRIVCLVPEGVAPGAVEAFLGGPAPAGASATRDALTVRVLPFVPQPDFDRLLWACDLNLVRGEDSWVRAQWARRPFVWHIYPQDEALHHKKLRAFLSRYAPGLPALEAFSLPWNGAAQGPQDWAVLWRGLLAELPAIGTRAVDWENQVKQNGDLAANLLAFAVSLRTPLR